MQGLIKELDSIANGGLNDKQATVDASVAKLNEDVELDEAKMSNHERKMRSELTKLKKAHLKRWDDVMVDDLKGKEKKAYDASWKKITDLTEKIENMIRQGMFTTGAIEVVAKMEGMDEAEGDAKETIKVLADTDYRDKDSFFKMAQLLKGLAAAADEDKTAKAYLTKVSDALTAAAKGVLGEDSELEEAKADAKKIIKILSDTDYRDKDAFFKMSQLLKGLAAVADEDEVAKKYLSKVSDELTKAAKGVAEGMNEGKISVPKKKGDFSDALFYLGDAAKEARESAKKVSEKVAYIQDGMNALSKGTSGKPASIVKKQADRVGRLKKDVAKIVGELSSVGDEIVAWELTADAVMKEDVELDEGARESQMAVDKWADAMEKKFKGTSIVGMAVMGGDEVLLKVREKKVTPAKFEMEAKKLSKLNWEYSGKEHGAMIFKAPMMKTEDIELDEEFTDFDTVVMCESTEDVQSDEREDAEQEVYEWKDDVQCVLTENL